MQQTLEQIDVMKRLVARYPADLALASTSAELEKAMKAGKIAGMLGMEGGHSIGSSLAVLRQMYDLGARLHDAHPLEESELGRRRDRCARA